MRDLVLTAAGFLCILLLIAPQAEAQTGKVAGQVTDSESGEPLPGVNVVIVGEQMGATTDSDGNYTILNVPPGTYTMRASFVGYADQVVEGINVNIDLTTTQNFELQEETQELEEVTVQASEPVVKPDISANTVNIESQDMATMPLTSVTDVVSQQAGFEGLSVRGSDLSELNLQVDGLSMRDGRTNAAFTAISYTSVEEIQVQTGGFNAEYGNVRSGLINVVTAEGPRDRYTADVMARYTPPHEKWQGPRPDHPMGYYMRPYLPEANQTYRGQDVPEDKNPAWVGTTNSIWDKYTQRQYPEFEGWNTIAENVRNADNGIDEFSPEDAVKVFKWKNHLIGPEAATKPLTPKEAGIPDFTIDGSFGGPVPLISDPLGDLRFFASVRQEQTAYPVPQQRQAYHDKLANLKLTSNVGTGMKLTIQGLYNVTRAVNQTNFGGTNIFTGQDMVNHLGWYSIFGNANWSPTTIYRKKIGGDFTHTLSASTFYTIRFQRLHSDYNTTAPFHRDETALDQFGDMEVTEEPLGWEPEGDDTIWGAVTGAHQGEARDSSEVARWSGQFDLTTQLNQYAQLKTGVDYIYSNYNTSYGEVDSFFVHHTNPYYEWNRQPVQGAAYAQTKLEFQGMIANAGLRLDYFDAGDQWYDYSTFDEAFSPKFGADVFGEKTGDREMVPQFEFSPRLGVSFPVTSGSKLYFNYGHFRQMLDPHNLFVLREINTGAVDQIGNPDHPMPKTVAYEMGYEHNLFNQFLLRLTGYYKALGDQPRGVNFRGVTGQVNYTLYKPWNYEDIRGAEISLRKNQGWLRGFVNYTYMVTKGGNFGLGAFHENDFRQREYESQVYYNQQHTPEPEPFARLNLAILAPQDFGPQLAGINPLGGWRVNFLGEWRQSAPFTYTGQSQMPRLENNVRWTDEWKLDMRLSRNVLVGPTEVQFFVDIQNVLDIKRLNRWGSFQGPTDWRDYMQSLHLPEGTFRPEDADEDEKVEPPYLFVPGDDQPGDYREEGVEFQPIEAVGNLDEVSNPHARPYYWEKESGDYFKYDGNNFVKADDGKVQEVLDTKAYIDMPNLRFARFVHPRRVQFGLRFSF